MDVREEIRRRKDSGMMADSPDASDGSCGTCGTPVHTGADVPRNRDNTDSGSNPGVVANSDENDASTSNKRKFEDDDSSTQENKDTAYSILDPKDARSYTDLFLKDLDFLFEDEEMFGFLALMVLPFLWIFIIYLCIYNWIKKSKVI